MLTNPLNINTFPNSFPALLEVMRNCEQTTGMNVHTHGMSVATSYLQMREELDNGIGDPTLLAVYNLVKDKILDDEVVLRYQEFHDCGKPFCRVVDEEGRVHFPDHANVSADLWTKMYPHEVEIQQLMRMDMNFHTFKGDDVDKLWDHHLSFTLYLTAWAEIKANCKMFGGEESVSFKIKKKHLIKAGKRFLKKI